MFFCNIAEEEIQELIENGNLETKRLATIGKKLELDRKKPELDYYIENLALARYWCNNAKTDTFSEEEFLKVVKVFNEIWNSRLKK